MTSTAMQGWIPTLEPVAVAALAAASAALMIVDLGDIFSSFFGGGFGGGSSRQANPNAPVPGESICVSM